MENGTQYDNACVVEADDDAYDARWLPAAPRDRLLMSVSSLRLAEIIAVGAELTSGAKLNTNSQWLSAQLSDLGIVTGWHTTITDDLAINVAALRLAVARADLVVVTGGLGPTLDDLTREAMAQLVGEELVLDPASLEFIEGYFVKRGRPMPERNRIQAHFPRSGHPLANPVGTAPGVWLAVPRTAKSACLIAALPGVPSEMYRMFHEQVVPRLPGQDRMILKTRINCFGCGESQAEELLGDLTARDRDPEVGITAHDATITLRIIAQGSTAEDCRAKIALTDRLIRERLGKFVYGVEDEELEDVISRELETTGHTVVTIETGTAGDLAERWIDAGSTCYLGGEVWPASRWQTSGPIDAQTREIARAARERMSADFALVVSPFPPLPKTLNAAPVEAWVALATPQEVLEERVVLSGNPAIQRSRTAKVASDLLRHYLTRRKGR